MGRLSTIENRLIEINETIFQELCDTYLSRVVDNYDIFSRTGSQTGKQKTIKGKPDSFFLLQSGEYIFVEHTTRSSDRKNKLKSDINDCLELAKKLEIPINKVKEIILCTNFNLNVKEVDDLKRLLKETNIKLTIKTLNELSIDILFHHQDLAHRYLELPLDTGQIVSIDQFVEEYSRASHGIATPLDNEFLHRENEKQNIRELLNNNDLVILSGKAGVGKTKLSINEIQEFISENPSFNAFCISYKGHTLLDDLYQYLEKDKDYILFVDDANRIDVFTQILGFYNAERTGSLKILITVRDYALTTIKRMCGELNFEVLILDKFTDDEIDDLIESDSFRIKNRDFKKPIKRIADGNPRLAIMTALLAIEKQDIRSLSDVSALFEKYFSTFIKDQGEFSSELNIKFLGIISFFNKVAYKNREGIEPILNIFNLQYSDFIESINKLGDLELLEIKFEHVSVPEQNLAMFFFYKAFIKDELLSFRLLLKNFHKRFSENLKDCVIHSNNTFGQERVMNKVKPELENYFRTIKSDDLEEKLKFLQTFWFYLQDQTLEFIYEISELEANQKIIADSEKKEPKEFFRPDEVIDLLSNLFITEKFQEAIELSFEVIRYNKSKAKCIVDKINDKFSFWKNDEYTNFKRQTLLIDSWLEKVTSHPKIFAPLFYQISKKFLQFEFEHTESQKKSVVFYRYPVPLTDEVKDIRSKIWAFLEDNFDSYPEKSFLVLENYMKSGLPEPKKEVLEFDLPFLIKIINKKLSESSIDHCHYVHELNYRYPTKSEDLEKLKNKFINESYKLYQKLNFEGQFIRSENKTLDFSEFREEKSKEIRSEFIFNSLKQFQEFYFNYNNIIAWQSSNFNTLDAFGFIIDENFKVDESLGIQILELILKNGNEINYIPSSLFSENFKSIEIEREVWNLIDSYEFKLKFNWQISFFNFADHFELNNGKIKVDDYLDMFRSINEQTRLFLKNHQVYYEKYPELPYLILEIVSKKISENELSITFRPDFFIDNLKYFNDKFSFLEEGYLSQLKLNNHFDLNGKALIKLLEVNKNFLLEYVKTHYSFEKYGHPEPTMNLSAVWEIDGIDETLKSVFNWVTKNAKDLGFNKQYCNVFFKDLDNERLDKAKNFILEYIQINNSVPSKINLIIDIIRNSLPDFFEEAFIHYLKLNQNKKTFSRIRWLDTTGSITGTNVYFGEIRAREWKDLLSIIENSDLGIIALPIKSHIKETISAEIKHADIERKREYLRGF